MSTGVIFYVLFSLFLKHLIIDFPIYSRYVCHDLSIVFSRLWYAHIILHGLATAFILYIISFPILICLLIGSVDTISHFLIDMADSRIATRCKRDPVFSGKFRWVTSLDQYLHTFVYLCLTFALVFI